MMYMYSNRGGGGFLNQIGCLIVGVLALMGLFWFMGWLYKALWYAAPVLLLIALVINWRVVMGTVTSLGKMLQREPIGGIFTAALYVVFFPLLTLYWIMAGLGMRRLKKFQQEFGQQWGFKPDDGFDFQNREHNPNDADYVDYEEIESRKKSNQQKTN